ncbi:MAG: hypothetical protein N3F66_01160 [Spirochaetes bacterium]|nr:hypothetical protein [Spirochaetota bacterium]
MIVFYIAVVIVISGVLLILYSEFFEVAIKKTLPDDRFVPDYDNEVIVSKTDKSKGLAVSKNNDVDVEELPEIDIVLEDRITTNLPNDSNVAKDTRSHIPKGKKGYEVVMYVDSSGTIGNISDSVATNDFSFLTRIGSGHLQYIQQGINITIDNKLYRYDFFRISSLKAHENYMLFTVKGKNAVHCIVLNEDSDILLDIEKEYNNFNES